MGEMESEKEKSKTVKIFNLSSEYLPLKRLVKRIRHG